MTFTAEDGPQDTAAAAYRHGADLAAAIAAKSRNQQLTAGSGPVFVRVEYVEHLAAGLAARAEEAKRRGIPR